MPKKSSYLSQQETAALLADSLEARQKRLAAADMLSTDEAAALAGVTRLTVNKWIGSGRAIGLSQVKRGYRLPRWQFEPAMWAALPKLSEALGLTEGWALLAFLETPLGGLDGRTPRQAIEQGEAERALLLAQHHGDA
jgi:hypothetical protein